MSGPESCGGLESESIVGPIGRDKGHDFDRLLVGDFSKLRQKIVRISVYTRVAKPACQGPGVKRDPSPAGLAVFTT